MIHGLKQQCPNYWIMQIYAFNPLTAGGTYCVDYHCFDFLSLIYILPLFEDFSYNAAY